MKIFIIADTHFGHKALSTEFQSRPVDFGTMIVKRWNKTVSKNDMVIHLGDVVVGKQADWSANMLELQGRKILVTGNHDHNTIHWYMANGFEFCCTSFSWQMFGLQILFSHEPSTDGLFDLNIHGHLHQGEHHEKEYELDSRHYLFSLEKNRYAPRALESMVKEWQKSKQLPKAGQ